MNNPSGSVQANMAAGRGVVGKFSFLKNPTPKGNASPKVTIASTGKKNHGFSLGTFEINGSKSVNPSGK